MPYSCRHHEAVSRRRPKRVLFRSALALRLPQAGDPYFIEGSGKLLSLFSTEKQVAGITLSTPGFYAPQVRSIRLSPFDVNLIQKLTSFQFGPLYINNFEMESSALYALSALMRHHAITICVAVANRITKEFLIDYKPAMESLIEMVLDKILEDD